MSEPIIIVNFKTYQRGTGTAATELAATCKRFDAWAAVQATDVHACAQTGCRVLSQHVDPIGFGKHTGSVLPEAVKEAGAWGTLLNHSERRLYPDVLAQTIERCKQVGLSTVVCAESVDEAVRIQELSPDFIAVELPELIGGDVSIVSADPSVVQEAVKRLGDNVIIGAGIGSADDIRKGLELGARGFLPASAVVQKADDPAEKLEEFYSAIT